MSQLSKERRRAKFLRQGGLCHWCKKTMILECENVSNGFKPPPNYATAEHLQRRRHGGSGKPLNIVLACKKCNNSRDAGIQTSPPLPANVAAKRMTNAELFQALADGTITDAARGELYTRGLVPNWPMWSHMVLTAKVPPP